MNHKRRVDFIGYALVAFGFAAEFSGYTGTAASMAFVAVGVILVIVHFVQPGPGPEGEIPTRMIPDPPMKGPRSTSPTDVTSALSRIRHDMFTLELDAKSAFMSVQHRNRLASLIAEMHQLVLYRVSVRDAEHLVERTNLHFHLVKPHADIDTVRGAMIHDLHVYSDRLTALIAKINEPQSQG